MLEVRGHCDSKNDGTIRGDSSCPMFAEEEGIKDYRDGHPLELLDEEFAHGKKNRGPHYSTHMIEKALQGNSSLLRGGIGLFDFRSTDYWGHRIER